ncbi:MAG: hypothetical protein PHU44_11065 [Syntrophales bacterium]|nr:hypothetical protein [Syntrophales bacterium]
MTRTKKYLDCFIKMAFFSGIIFGLFMGLMFGFGPGIKSGIIFGIGVSTVVILVLIPIDYFLTRNLPAEALKVNQNREIHVKGDFEKVFEECLQTLKKLKYIRRIYPLKDEMTISARTKISNASWGEDIKLIFRLNNNNIINIDIYSTPVMKFTLLDYGKNFKNVENIAKEIICALEG